MHFFYIVLFLNFQILYNSHLNQKSVMIICLHLPKFIFTAFKSLLSDEPSSPIPLSSKLLPEITTFQPFASPDIFYNSNFTFHCSVFTVWVMWFAGDLFHSGWCTPLLVPSRFLLDDCRGPSPISDGCEGVRHWTRLQTLVPNGGIWSSRPHSDAHSHCGHLQRWESLWERRAVREL